MMGRTMQTNNDEDTVEDGEKEEEENEDINEFE